MNPATTKFVRSRLWRWVAVGLAVLGVAFVVWRWSSGPLGIGVRNQPDASHPAPGTSHHSVAHMTLRDIDFIRGVDGTRFLRLQAERVRLVDKQVGFFSIGGLRQLEMERLRLTLYQPGLRAVANRQQSADENAHASRQGEEKARQSFLSAAFDGLSGAGGGLERIAGFEARSTQLVIRSSDTSLLTLHADQMRLAPEGAALVCTGNVRLRWRKREMALERATLYPRRFLLQTASGTVFHLLQLGRPGYRPSRRDTRDSWH